MVVALPGTSSKDRTLSPARPPAADLPVLVLGCHGGAGTTTVAGLIGAQYEWGTHVPRKVYDTSALLVARGTAHGAQVLLQAHTYLRQLGFPPAAAVVVADGPWREPAPVRSRLRMLSAHLPLYRLPYVPRWRYVDNALADAAHNGIPRPALSVIRQLRRDLAAPSTPTN